MSERRTEEDDTPRPPASRGVKSQPELDDESDYPAEKKRGTASTWGRMIAISHVGYTFIGAFGIPTAIGVWIDAKTGSSPWGVIGGVTLGLVLSTVLAWRETRSTGARISPHSPRRGTPPKRARRDS